MPVAQGGYSPQSTARLVVRVAGGADPRAALAAMRSVVRGAGPQRGRGRAPRHAGPGGRSRGAQPLRRHAHRRLLGPGSPHHRAGAVFGHQLRGGHAPSGTGPAHGHGRHGRSDRQFGPARYVARGGVGNRVGAPGHGGRFARAPFAGVRSEPPGAAFGPGCPGRASGGGGPGRSGPGCGHVCGSTRRGSSRRTDSRTCWSARAPPAGSASWTGSPIPRGARAPR